MGNSNMKNQIAASTNATNKMKSYFSNMTKGNPVSSKKLEESVKILGEKVQENHLISFSENCIYNEAINIDLASLEKYADVHIRKLHFVDEENRKKVKDTFLLAGDQDSSKENFLDVNFIDNEFDHYQGYIYSSKSGDKVSISYVFVMIRMKKTEDSAPLSFEEIALIRDNYMYNKALCQLKSQGVIETVPMIEEWMIIGNPKTK